MKAVSLLGILVVAALAARLVVIQVWACESYMARAKSQHEKRVTLRATRGRILDRHARVLATSLESQSFFVHSLCELDSVRSFAVRFRRRHSNTQAGFLSRLRKRRPFVWVARQVMDGPSEDELPEGIGRVVEMRRNYPMGTLAGQVLGFTSVDHVGIEGVELQYNALLTGSSGEMVSRVDARGEALNAFGELVRLPDDGADVVLTLDADFQSIAEEELSAAVDSFRAKSGIAIVMDPRTGEILAMADVPLYDPNAFAKYGADVRRNRAVTDVVEPGSTFKIVAISAALEEGVHVPGDQIFCENGTMELPGGECIRDVHPRGWLSLGKVIEESSNIGASKVARNLGPARLNRYIRRFGFGLPTGVALPGEVPGVVRHPSLWSGRSLETLSFGQEIGVTALQVGAAYGAVANGGLLMVPKILRYTSRGDSALHVEQPQVARRVVSEETATQVRGFLEAVVDSKAVHAKVPGYRVAGKTGTAQRALEGVAGYDPGSHISSFVGFLPAEDPDLLCVVMVDSPDGVHWGSQVAAPVFSRIMQRILSLRGTPLRHRAGALAGGGVHAPPSDPPAVEGLLRETALRVLARTGWPARVSGRGTRVVRQQTNADDGTVDLFVAGGAAPEDGQRVSVPNVVGVPLRQAVSQLTGTGLQVRASGSGWVVGQVPTPGTAVARGTVCRVTCGSAG